MSDTALGVGGMTMDEAAADVGTDCPDFNRGYSLVYAFTLLWTLIAILATGPIFFRTGDAGFGPSWLLLPLLGLLCALLLEGPWSGAVSLAKRTALLGALGMVGGFALTFSLMMALAVVSPLMSRDNLPVMGAIAVGTVVLLAVPLMISAWRVLRHDFGPKAVLEAAVMLLAVAALGVLAYFSTGRSHVFTEVLRRGQSSFIAANVVWFVPSYALAVALWRRWVTG